MSFSPNPPFPFQTPFQTGELRNPVLCASGSRDALRLGASRAEWSLPFL